MKTRNNMVKTLVCLTGLTIGGYAATAQPYLLNPPHNPNNTWFGVTNPIGGLNTAMIDYGLPPSGVSSIAAAVYNELPIGGASKVYVKDLATATSANISYFGAQSTPDVVIGNYVSPGAVCSTCTPSRDYILAAAYSNGTTVKIDFYDVHDDGTNPITINALSSTTVIGHYQIHTVHIDVVVDYNHPFNNFLMANKFVVTWDDFSVGGGASVVYAAEGDLSAGTVGSAVLITPVGVYGEEPDVAGIQKMPGCGTHALITYHHTQVLYLADYDFLTGTLVSNTLIDNCGSSGCATISKPRIDAYDDCNSNMYPGVSNYKVVAQVLNTTTNKYEIRNYDNQTLAWPMPPRYFVSSNVIDMSVSPPSPVSVGLPPYNHYAPTVALGAPFAYDIQHYSHDGVAGGGNHNMIFMEAIHAGCPTCLTSFSGTMDYFWVNGNPSAMYTIDASACQYANAVAAPPNDYNRITMNAWAYYDGTGYSVDYKTSTLPYAYKQGAGIANSMEHGWQLYPNPASNEVKISVATWGKVPTSYTVIDMAGRAAKSGQCFGREFSINIADLAPGNYILKTFSENAGNGEALFVKQ